jgi:hypothetical protein
MDAAASATDVSADTTPTPPSYLPLAVGNSWTYRVEHPKDGTFTKVNRVEKMDEIPFGPRKGTPAFLLVTTKVGGTNGVDDRTDSWQLPDGSHVLRFAERSYKNVAGTVNEEIYWMPSKLRVDGTAAHTTAGAIWEERYAEFTAMQSGIRLITPLKFDEVDTWTVEAADETVTVDAGTFSKCVRLKKAGSSTDAGKTYWYCLGVGKVKELGRAGSGQNEYLTTYTLK